MWYESDFQADFSDTFPFYNNISIKYCYSPQTKFEAKQCFYSHLTETPRTEADWTEAPWTETPWTEANWTETPMDRDCPGQRLLDKDPPRQRPSCTKNLLDREPPWTETPQTVKNARYTSYWNAFLFITRSRNM